MTRPRESSGANANGVKRGNVAELSPVRFIPLSYDSHNSDKSALQLVSAVCPEWDSEESNVKLERCKDGITNTLLKVVNERKGLSAEAVERDALLLRAYGHGTQVLIDRQRETENHELLMAHGLAPELLARFHNGMLYRYIRGTVTSVEDLRKPAIYSAVARRLAEWHATIPCLPGKSVAHPNGNGNGDANEDANGNTNGDSKLHKRRQSIENAAPGKPSPNLWTVMQKWILALPDETEAQRERQATLQGELGQLIKGFSQRPGLGENGLVFAHCDLLHGNIIVEPAEDANAHANADADAAKSGSVIVSFIDYEYATPSPAAFDIANHFAEWAGFECNYEALPSRSERRDFIRNYVETYFDKLPNKSVSVDADKEASLLLEEVDQFRGVPGFYWGIWALIQAVISDIDFDYASYAEDRLAEYWAWKGEADGSRKATGKELPFREKRWAEE